MPPTLTVRAAEPQDAPVLLELCRQLGREASLDDVRVHLERGRSEAGHCLLVALESGSVRGWLEVATRTALGSPAWAEISGLVVDEARRGQGVGAELVRAAGAWARGQGLARLRVRTRVERKRAARFYVGAGFRLRKQQQLYELEL